MKFGKIIGAFAPLAGLALAAALSGCDTKIDFDGKDMRFNGKEGKKLAELDMTGAPPSELALLGPDEVQVTLGDKLAITVDGDAAAKDSIRFARDGETLGILRDRSTSAKADGRAVVRITMPAPREVIMLGSGRIVTPAMAANAKVVVAGSGEIDGGAASGDSLEVTIPGSGEFRTNGSVRSLELTVLGSGSAQMDALKVEKAKITMAGSGDAAFASDGEVEATIVGSGEVRVIGRARCKISAVGSGRLVCENGTTSSDPSQDQPEPPVTPAPESK
jgi:Putative auto-transporter adhesin, head GIN domain